MKKSSENLNGLSEALRLIRRFYDVQQIKLAAELGISRSYLSEIESGRKIPSIDLLSAYADRFEIPLSSILLFSETVKEDGLAEKARTLSSKAALKFLRWVDEKRAMA